MTSLPFFNQPVRPPQLQQPLARPPAAQLGPAPPVFACASARPDRRSVGGAPRYVVAGDFREPAGPVRRRLLPGGPTRVVVHAPPCYFPSRPRPARIRDRPTRTEDARSGASVIASRWLASTELKPRRLKVASVS